MAKIHGLKYVICLCVSILLNLFFLSHRFLHQERELSWSKGAAIEAEDVASISCSGHGRAYLDGLHVEGKQPICECNSCYLGPDCSDFSAGCLADADSGDPIFLEPFWLQHAASSAVVVAGWHRMSYQFDDNFISKELERHIRELHVVIGNAVTTGRFIVFGAGSIQLLNAAVHALSPEDSSSPASVVASAPFYPVYQTQTDFFKSVDFKWQGDTSLWHNISDSSKNFIEFVTSPSNPDGALKKSVLQGPTVNSIYDHAYYWPHFTAIPAPANEDLMIFTLSKITGHAGSRFGWALIKDESVYQRILTYMKLNTIGVSHDTQLRALKLLKVVLKKEGRELFGFGYKTMRKRWDKLNKSLSNSKRFSLQELKPRYCTYFEDVVGPSPAYAWLKCEREEDQDCTAVFKTAGIIGREGSIFGAESRHVRLSLIKSQDDFDLLLQRIDAMVSLEGGIEII